MFKTPAKSTLHTIQKIQASVFRETLNPQKIRTGSKILTKPLIGQTVANYYGSSNFPTVSKLCKFLSDESYNVVNPHEEYRLDQIASKKRRGKGAPKKIREAPSAKAGGKKKK